MKNTKLLTIPMVLIVALAMAGIAYAHWSQTLYIEGTVHTNTFTLGFTELTCAEKYVDEHGIKQDGEYLGKDVGWFECEMANLITDPVTGLSGNEKCIVTIHNAYPCYWVHITFVITNLGTTPAHFKDLRIIDPTGELNFVWDIPWPASPAKGHMWKDFNGDGVESPDEEILNFEVIDGWDAQLHTGDMLKAEVDVHLKQPAEQGHTYEFVVEIEGIQWNAWP